MKKPQVLFVADQATLREAADSLRVPFIWLPPHERAGANGLIGKLSREYAGAGKPFLLAASGDAGVYPPESHWLIPKGVNDAWVRRHLAPLIAVTDALDGVAAPIVPRGTPVFYHTGCLGDIIAALPVIRHLGGGKLVIGNYTYKPWAWKNMEGIRFEAIRALLEAQPYIESVRFEHGAAHTHDLANWRAKHRRDRTLTASQADWLGITETIDMSPWLTGVTPWPMAKDKIVVARTMRYRNPDFPWRRLVQKHWRRMLFVGLPDEHKDFCHRMSARIEYVPTRDLMAVAGLIAGSALFIGNQSCHVWIAMALGHPLIQEMSPVTQDSRVLRGNAQFVMDGQISQPVGLAFAI